MPITKRGIYHNLKESKYTVSNLEIVFFFSSELYLYKFLDSYETNRETYHKKFKKNHNTKLNFDTLYDVMLYKDIEKRGFRATLKGQDIDYNALQYYSLRKMTDLESPVWYRVITPTIKERVVGEKPSMVIFDEFNDVGDTNGKG